MLQEIINKKTKKLKSINHIKITMDIQTLENKQSYNVLLLGDFHMQEY